TNPSKGSRGNSRVAPTTDSLAGAPIAPASPSPERGERSPSQEWRQQLASSWFSPSGVAVSGQFAGELTSANHRGRRVPSDNRHCRLLRAHRERPRRCRAADERDDVAPFHCPMPPVLPNEGIAHLGTAALRDFNPAYVVCGSISTVLAEADAAIHVRYASNSSQDGEAERNDTSCYWRKSCS